MDPVTLLTFVGAGILLNLTPGADVLFATASGLRGGWRAGVAAASGISLGALVHTAFAAAGLAAILAAKPASYDVIRWLGAAYLAYLAVKTWRSGPPARDTERGSKNLMPAVWRGFLTNVLNPKVAVFILAFLPQFTDPVAGPVWQQIAVLGTVFATTGFVITAVYGAFAGLAGATLSGATGFLNKLAAIVFGGLALRLVWE